MVSFVIMQFKSEGEGGMPEFMASLPEGDVAWGAFKVVGVDDRGNTVSRRPKYIMVKWAPAGAKTMRKARVGKTIQVLAFFLPAEMSLISSH
jgi:hypothetical protein